MPAKKKRKEKNETDSMVCEPTVGARRQTAPSDQGRASFSTQHLEEVSGFFLPCRSYNNPNETRSRSFEDLRIATASWVRLLVSRFIGGLWIFWQGFHRAEGGGVYCISTHAPSSLDGHPRGFACTTFPDYLHAWVLTTGITCLESFFFFSLHLIWSSPPPYLHTDWLPARQVD